MMVSSLRGRSHWTLRDAVPEKTVSEDRHQCCRHDIH